MFDNNIAVFGWVVMALWTGMLLVFTFLFLRDGGFHQFNPLIEGGVMGLFWLVGLACCVAAFSIPIVRLTIDGKVAVVRERWGWRSRTERFSLSSIAKPLFKEGKDTDGDPYFRCSITTPGGRTVVISEHHDRARVEAAYDRLLAAMG